MYNLCFCQNIGYDPASNHGVAFTLEKRRMAGMLLFRVSLVTLIIQQFATGLQGEQPQEFTFAENRFFPQKKDGTKPSFLVTIFSWKIKAICTDFVRYCLCTVLPQKAYWFSAGASAAGAIFPAGAGAGAVAVTGLSERTPFRPAARPASP